MSFSNDNGYIPTSIEAIMSDFREKINTQFLTEYDQPTFEGTNFYKYFYGIAQRMQLNEVKTSEIFLKLQQYFTLINEKISRPVNTNPGIVDKFLLEGFIASVKPMILVDAGKINICVDTDPLAVDYAAVKTQICVLLSQITVGGAVTQGAESEAVVLSNGQSFDFKYTLPTVVDAHLRLTITTSENNQSVILQPEDVKASLLSNIASRYSLGKNFEPQKYFSILDAPWAGQVVLEWSDDAGASWNSTVFDSNFNDLFKFDLLNVTLVEI